MLADRVAAQLAEPQARSLSLMKKSRSPQNVYSSRPRPAETLERYDFTHALIRETLYSELSPSRQVRLHRQIAEAMEHVYGDRVAEHAAEIAHHYHRSATLPGAERGTRYALLAAGHAERNTAFADAAAHLRVALDLQPASDPQRPRTLATSCAWGDYNNDGFIDLYVNAADLAFPVPSRTHNLLYRNNGDGTFTKVTDGPVATDLTVGSSGATWGDYDKDGFLDLFVSQGGFAPDPQTNLLYHNDGNGNGWLNVKLVGTVSNRSGIGAKVRVNANYRDQSRWQVRQISGGDGESNQQALNAAFGLADASTVDTLRVEWPSGAVQELHNVAPRQFLTITEPYCAGDCDNNGLVTVDKLLTLVNIALGKSRR